MTAVSVRFQATPNPNAGKFVVAGARVSEGTKPRSFFSAEEAKAHPVADAIFRLEGVANVFMVEDFVTVTKSQGADWRELVPRVVEAIKSGLES